MNRTVLIYAKPPMMGLAKTRLAAGLGAAEAQRIARWSFTRTLRACKDPRWTTVLSTTPDRYLGASLGGLWPPILTRTSQGRGDLTDRLTKGLREAARGHVLFIGADCPDITTALIARAFECLKRADAVFGPARDGGFWLFGMPTHAPSPFGGVRWSGPYAMADVKANLQKGSKVALLPELIDIDDAADWRDWNLAAR